MLGLTVVGDHQVPSSVSDRGSTEAQMGPAVLQGVQMLLRNHTEDVEMMGKIWAYDHLSDTQRKVREIKRFKDGLDTLKFSSQPCRSHMVYYFIIQERTVV